MLSEKNCNWNSTGNNHYDINKEHVIFLLNLGHSITEIAQSGLLGGKMHQNTLANFMKQNNILPPRQRFTTKSDEEIKLIISEITKKFPNSGICEIVAMLRCRDPPILIQRDRIQKLLCVVNPPATARRWAQVLPRRTYSVPTPNSLWHLDTHHSLIR